MRAAPGPDPFESFAYSSLLPALLEHPSSILPNAGYGLTRPRRDRWTGTLLLLGFRRLRAAESLTIPATEYATGRLNLVRMTCPPFVVIFAASFVGDQIAEQTSVR